MKSFSAKLTVVLYILVCFEIGALLVFLPWHRTWQENNLLFLLAEWFDWPSLRLWIVSGWVRGFVTGLGVVNILIGVREIISFSRTVRSLGGDSALSDH
ncbi:MAG: hypothetical protein IT175_11585 [Acidobacteria bacterium]|nr:hypothetical protein [Acidobacteriota bacterium]